MSSITLPQCILKELNNMDNPLTVPNTYTENGAPAYSTTNDKVLDFFVQVVRGASESYVKDMFRDAFNDDNRLALACLAHLRDIREGKGERDVARYALLWLRENHYKIYVMNLPYFISLGYYKDLCNIVKSLSLSGKLDNSKTVNPIELQLLAEQIMLDRTRLQTDKKDISLAAKWAPSNGSLYDSADNGNQAYRLAKIMFPHSKTVQKDYRKTLSSLREHLKIVERHMCGNEWDKINFAQVPSKAHKNLRKAFQKHQSERYTEYLESLVSGETKINTTGIQPHELVQSYMSTSYYSNTSPLDQTIEAQWSTMVNKIAQEGLLNDSLAIIDVSGSMSGLPMQVAIALGLLTSQLTREPFKNHCITFSQNPQLHHITGETLKSKVDNLVKMDWAMNTDLLKVFNLILKRAQKYNVNQNEMIKTLFIFTDMQFDCATGYKSNWNTTYDNIKNMYDEAGYTMPQIVFWNLRATKASFPCTSETKGVALVSGFSAELLKMFMTDCEYTPMAILMETLKPYLDNIVL